MEVGDPEYCENGIADELLDGAAVPFQRVRHRVEVPPHDAAQTLGIEGLAERRRLGDVGEDHRDDLPGLVRRGRRRLSLLRGWLSLGHDDASRRQRRLGCGGRVERRVLDEDRALEPRQGGARLDAELVEQRALRLVVRVERLRLPAGAVESEDQQAAEALAERMLCDEAFELTDEVGVAPQLQLRVDAIFDRDEPQRLEPCDLRLGERLEREVGERSPIPEIERRLVAARPLCGDHRRAALPRPRP